MTLVGSETGYGCVRFGGGGGFVGEGGWGPEMLCP